MINLSKKLLNISYIKKNGNNKHYAIGNHHLNIDILKINFLTINIHTKLLKRYAKIKLNIPKIMLPVNNLHENFGLLVYSGIIKAAPNQPAARLTNKSEIIPSQIESISATLARNQDTVNNGQIDDFRVFNYELSANQVKNLYNGGAVRFGPATGPP